MVTLHTQPEEPEEYLIPASGRTYPESYFTSRGYPLEEWIAQGRVRKLRPPHTPKGSTPPRHHTATPGYVRMTLRIPPDQRALLEEAGLLGWPRQQDFRQAVINCLEWYLTAAEKAAGRPATAGAATYKRMAPIPHTLRQRIDKVAAKWGCRPGVVIRYAMDHIAKHIPPCL